MSIDVKRRLASTAFVILLLLSVVWPSPIVGVNRLCCNAPLAIDELSFLGREAPSWDVVFWCICGLLRIRRREPSFINPQAVFQPHTDIAAEHRGLARNRHLMASGADRRPFEAFAEEPVRRLFHHFDVVWMRADSAVNAWSERVNSDQIEDWIRVANRFGGGMNPVMIIVFFALAGIAYGSRRWIGYAIRMTVAGAAGGVIVQLTKFAVGRTRPELWLGPFHQARASASSFPSGHTVGAFALAGVLIFTAESRTLRVIAALLAFAFKGAKGGAPGEIANELQTARARGDPHPNRAARG